MKAKYLFAISITLLLSFYSNAQEKVYEAIRISACNCFNERMATGFKFSDLKSCLTQAMQENIQMIQGEVLNKFPDSLSYEKGYEWGQQLGRRLDTGLVYTCDVYFKMSDSLRFSMYNVYNKDSLKQRLQIINEGNNNGTTDFFIDRGRANFLLGHYKEAYGDAEEVLRVQPSNIGALMIKAYFLEIDKKYEEAALLYYQLSNLTGQNAFLVSAAISNRKRKEQGK